MGRKGRNAKPRKRDIILEELARWVRLVFFWYVEERRPIVWIVRELNRQGAPKNHHSSKPHWHHSLVISLLSKGQP